jgi:WD40 repeat protein
MATSPGGGARPLRLESASGADAVVAAHDGASVALAGPHVLPFTGAGEPLGAVHAGRPPAAVAFAPAAGLLVTAHVVGVGTGGEYSPQPPAVQVFHVPAVTAAAAARNRLPPAARRVAQLTAADVGAPAAGGGCALLALSPDGRTLVTVGTPAGDSSSGSGAAQLSVWLVAVCGGGDARPSTTPPPRPDVATEGDGGDAPPAPLSVPLLKSPLDSLKARLRGGGSAGGGRRPSTASAAAVPSPPPPPLPPAPLDVRATADAPTAARATPSPVTGGASLPPVPRTPTLLSASLTLVGRGRVSQRLRRVAFAPDGSVVATAGDGHLKLWRLPGSPSLPPLPQQSPARGPAEHVPAPTPAAVSLLLRSLPATLPADGPRVRGFIDVCVIQPARTAAGAEVADSTPAPDGDELEVCALSDDGAVCVFGSDGHLLRHTQLPLPHDAAAHRVSAAPGGDSVCVGTTTGVVVLNRRSLAVTGVWQLSPSPPSPLHAGTAAAAPVSIAHAHAAAVAGTAGAQPPLRFVVGTSDGAVSLCESGLQQALLCGTREESGLPPSHGLLLPVRRLVRPAPSLLAAASVSLPSDVAATSASSSMRQAVTLTAARSGLVARWPPRAGAHPLQTTRHGASSPDAPLAAAAFSADGTLVAVADVGGACGVYDTCSGSTSRSDGDGCAPLVTHPPAEAGASSVTALAAGRLLPPSPLDGNAAPDSSSMVLPADLSEAGSSFQSVQQPPSGNNVGDTPTAGGAPPVPPAGVPLLAVGCSDGRLTLLAVGAGEPACQLPPLSLPGHDAGAAVSSVVISADGRVVVSADATGRVCVSRIALSTAGGAADGALPLLQLRRQRTLSLTAAAGPADDAGATADASAAYRPQLALHPGGNYVAAVSGTAGATSVRIVSLRAGRVVRTLTLPQPEQHPPPTASGLSPVSVAFDGSGLLMAVVWQRDSGTTTTAAAAAASTSLVTVVDFYSGQLLCGGATAEAAAGSASPVVAFSADARRLLLAAVGGGALVWRLPRSLAAAAGERSDEAASVCSRPSSARSARSVRSPVALLGATSSSAATRRPSVLPSPLAAAALVSVASGSCLSPPLSAAAATEECAGAGSPTTTAETPPPPPPPPHEELPPSPSLSHRQAPYEVVAAAADEPLSVCVEEDLPTAVDDAGAAEAAHPADVAPLPVDDDAPVPEEELVPPSDVTAEVVLQAVSPTAASPTAAAAVPPDDTPPAATMAGDAVVGGSSAWWEVTAVSAISPSPASGGGCGGSGMPYRGRAVSAVSATTEEDAAELPPRLLLPDSTGTCITRTWCGTDTRASTTTGDGVAEDADAPSYLDGLLLPLTLQQTATVVDAHPSPVLVAGTLSAISTPVAATPLPESPFGAPPSLDLSVSLDCSGCPPALGDDAAGADAQSTTATSGTAGAASHHEDGSGPPSATTCRLLTADHAGACGGGTVTPAYLQGPLSPGGVAFRAGGGSSGGAPTPVDDEAAAAAAALDASLAAALAVLTGSGSTPVLPGAKASLLRSLRAARDAIDGALAAHYGSGGGSTAEEACVGGAAASAVPGDEAAAAPAAPGPEDSGELPAYLQAS